MNRRDFICSLAAAGAFASPRARLAAADAALPPPVLDRSRLPPRNRNPYAHVDWSTCLQINGTTHLHDHGDLPRVVKERQIGFLTASNYYPSKPMYPWRAHLRPEGAPTSDWPVMVNGRLTKGPFDWNEIIKPWQTDVAGDFPLPSPVRAYPEGAFPDDMLEAPNAEHHSFKLANGKEAWELHICAPGSAYASGTFDAHDRYKTFSHGYHYGSGEFWGTAIDRMIDALILPDGGGVTVNHPTWSNLNRGLLLEILDWDPRVLGLEVIEGAAINSEHYWDWVLSTGRQCFGFFVPDHEQKEIGFGVSVLLVPERTQAACLRAYRQGQFYGAWKGLGELKFTHLSYHEPHLLARTDRPAHLEIKTARGIVAAVDGTEIRWELPPHGQGVGRHAEIFARVKATATDGSGEVLFSQPFMLA